MASRTHFPAPASPATIWRHRLAIFETAVRYQMFHAIALIANRPRTPAARYSRAWRFAAWAFLVGIILFCGSLKVLTFAGPKWNWLGAIVPFGGASMIVGWLALGICALEEVTTLTSARQLQQNALPRRQIKIRLALG